MGTTKRLIAILGIALVASVAAPAAQGQTLTGAEAQDSPQADVFLAYEQALLWDGIDAAGAYMTPERLADMQEMVRLYGEDAFRDFQIRQREGTAQGDDRRRQIESVVIAGNTAILSARSDPQFVDQVWLAETADGWKISSGLGMP